MTPTDIYTTGNPELDAALARIRTATRQQLMELSDEVQDKQEQRTNWLAWLLAAGLLSLLAWHLAMRRLVKDHLQTQMVLGTRGQPPDEARLRLLLEREEGYLERFAGQLESKKEHGPLNGDGIANRARLYLASGRGLFYQTLEENGPAEEGWVAEFFAVGPHHLGDESTCDPCFRAAKQRFFLPGQGAFPGIVCAGQGHCRCRRVLRWMPHVWRHLMGLVAA